MKLNAMMMVNAVVAAVFGVAFVIVPGQLASLYGVTADAPLRYVGQLFGSALLALAIVTWLARNATDSDARRAIVHALAIGNTVGFVVALLGQFGGVVNALGWSTVAIYLLLALGFVYFALRRPAPAA
jgi:hypothetical protein